jgi:hypothetical protein
MPATTVTHPDEIWSPRGSELAPPQRPLSGSIDYATVTSERPAARETMGDDVPGFTVAAARVRAAVRPGAVA